MQLLKEIIKDWFSEDEADFLESEGFLEDLEDEIYERTSNYLVRHGKAYGYYLKEQEDNAQEKDWLNSWYERNN